MEMALDDAWDLVEKTVLHNQRYSTPRSARKSGGIYDVDTGKAIVNEIANLRKQIEGLQAPPRTKGKAQVVCQICGVANHTARECDMPASQPTERKRAT